MTSSDEPILIYLYRKNYSSENCDYLPFQLLPLTGVDDRLAFALKVGGLILALNGTGAWLYWRGAKHGSGAV